MINVISGRITAGLALATAAAVAVTMLDAQQESAVLPLECELTIAAELLPISEEPYEVEARITEAVGEELAAEFAEESRVAVVSVAGAEDDPQAVRLTVNTQDAVPGDWSVVVRGEAGECTGTATVGPIDPASR
jgi:hypothetical protein